MESIDVKIDNMKNDVKIDKGKGKMSESDKKSP